MPYKKGNAKDTQRRGVLTKRKFEDLLRKASQPIRKGKGTEGSGAKDFQT